MNGPKLRSTAGFAGTMAAAAAGALTVGLIAGVVHTATQAQGTTSTGTSSSTSSSGTSTSSKSGTSSASGLGSVPQNAAPVGGSNGS
jgi:hypothetical protein